MIYRCGFKLVYMLCLEIKNYGTRLRNEREGSVYYKPGYAATKITDQYV